MQNFIAGRDADAEALLGKSVQKSSIAYKRALIRALVAHPHWNRVLEERSVIKNAKEVARQAIEVLRKEFANTLDINTKNVVYRVLEKNFSIVREESNKSEAKRDYALMAAAMYELHKPQPLLGVDDNSRIVLIVGHFINQYVEKESHGMFPPSLDEARLLALKHFHTSLNNSIDAVKTTTLTYLNILAARQYSLALNKQVEARAVTSKAQQATPPAPDKKKENIVGNLSEGEWEIIKKHFNGIAVKPVPVPTDQNTMIIAVPICITARGSVLYRQLSGKPPLYEATFKQLEACGKGNIDDLMMRIKNKKPVHFLIKAMTNHVDLYKDAERNAKIYNKELASENRMIIAGDLSESDRAAIRHEFKGREDVVSMHAPLNQWTEVKGIVFYVTERGSALYRQDADMVKKGFPEVVEATIARLQQCAGRGSINDILYRIKHRVEVRFLIPPLDGGTVASMKSLEAAEKLQANKRPLSSDRAIKRK